MPRLDFRCSKPTTLVDSIEYSKVLHDVSKYSSMFVSCNLAYDDQKQHWLCAVVKPNEFEAFQKQFPFQLFHEYGFHVHARTPEDVIQNQYQTPDIYDCFTSGFTTHFISSNKSAIENALQIHKPNARVEYTVGTKYIQGKRTDKLCIVFRVEHKGFIAIGGQCLPKTIGNIPTDITETNYTPGG